ncbi:MAG TPA: RNA-binding protein, partial [Chitinophagaceae bacterium]|nr:RNA-binding protein [Chitinophagaceae bacterium]
MNLNVSNIGLQVTHESLHALFSTYGTVGQARLVIDPATGSHRGQALVHMPHAGEAAEAVRRLNGSI